MPRPENPRIPDGVDIPDRPPVAVRTGPSAASMRPEFVWVEVEGEAVHPRTGETIEVTQRLRAVPQATVDAAAEMAAHVVSLVEDASRETPSTEQIQNRILHVMNNIPPGSSQQVVALAKDSPPWWGVTTKGSRRA